MKNSTLILVISMLLSLVANAQMSGTYTIGGTAPDYATIQSAVTSLQTNGVNGAVTFNIRSGTYTGKVSMGNVNGASAVNTITFQSESGDSTDVVIADSSSASSSSNFTVLVNGTDYVTFRHLTIERIGSLAYASVFYIGSGSKSFQLRNNIIRSGNTTSTAINSSLVYVPLGNATDSNLVIASNTLQGGSFGINMIGQGASQLIPGLEISDNNFVNNYYRSIYLYYHAAPLITRNTFTITGANTGYVSIYMNVVNDAIRVTKNKITSDNGRGIYQVGCAGVSGSEGLIANNFISVSGTGTGGGFYLDGSSFQNILNNSVLVLQSAANASALSVYGGTTSNVRVYNNLLVSTGGGLAVLVDVQASAGFNDMDYNDIVGVFGDTAITSWSGTTQSSLANWQTASGQDMNSVSADPQFISAADLHVGSPLINNAGLPFAEVVDDIDGDLRNPATPDLGADEFTPLDANIGLLAFVDPSSGSCGNTTTTVAVLIKNFGQLPQTNIDVAASVTGAVTATLTELYTNTLGPGTTDTVRFTQTIDTYTGGTVDITAWSELVGEQYLLNDTISGSFDFGSHPNPPVVQSPQQQCNTNVQITAQPDSGDALAWYAEASGGSPLFVGDVFSPVVFGDTTFYVESRQGSGTSGCLRITECEPGGTNDYIEIQNLSGGTLDATGWKVFLSDDYTDINLVNSISWDLGVFAPGEIQYRTDGTNDNYWGNNIFWNPGSSSWAIIIDNNGAVIDYVVWDYDSATIQSMNVTLNGFPVTIGSEWNGAGITSCAGATTMTRIGTEDQNSAADFSCVTESKGIQNTGLTPILQNCGIGACGSQRIPVDITLVSGVTTSLGNDTVLAPPFSYPLDAGAGFTAYLWSDGSTAQTLVVAAPGIYWVTVTGANGCTYTDSISITIPVGMGGNLPADVMSMAPNPVTSQLVISGGEIFRHALQFRILDLQGREILDKRIEASGLKSYTIDMTDVNQGIYFIQMIAPEGMLIQRFSVIR
ncbi:MAG TPA: T9SS type A sorting domain-containing protein [Bacteroidia bacterium]|nr:T9SS type A sorting domain-containing protein [Bacteroidia bacterium]